MNRENNYIFIMPDGTLIKSDIFTTFYQDKVKSGEISNVISIHGGKEPTQIRFMNMDRQMMNWGGIHHADNKLPIPKPFLPKRGDTICVSHTDQTCDWFSSEFFAMTDDMKFLCHDEDDIYRAYKYGKQT